MGPFGLGFAPYANSCGMNLVFPPGFMSCSPSVHPLITLPKGKDMGSPRLYDESNSVSSMSVPR